ncbi:MAG: phenylacetate-CoA oxygenase subunit PaaC [Bacteroidetes bacterium]|nr:phenylacetate-CoA oxygenase subunit PaaC [Bacteroidota bacterium]
MTKQEALYKYSIRLGDDALILGHRLSELCSRSPFIEEDLALTNISLDLIGRAQALLGFAAEIEGKGKDADFLAYRRPEIEYQNHLLNEQPNGDFAFTIARQFFVSAFEFLFYSELEKSKDANLAAIASKAIKEIKYHQQHAAEWVIRLGDGTEKSHAKMQHAIDELWMWTGELFEMDEVENLLIKEGIGVDLVPLKAAWYNQIQTILTEATLSMPEDGYMQTGGRKGVHTENLGHILSEMQYLQRAYPDATW